VVETVESAVMWVEGPMAGLCGSWASGTQEGAVTVVGLVLGLFVDLVEAASDQWWAQW
jgi:hypothetical protein